MSSSKGKVSAKKMRAQKSARINARITPGDKEKLEAMAKTKGMNLSKYLAFLAAQKDNADVYHADNESQKKMGRMYLEQIQDKEDIRRVFEETKDAIYQSRGTLSPGNEQILLSSITLLFKSYIRRADKRCDEYVDSADFLHKSIEAEEGKAGRGEDDVHF